MGRTKLAAFATNAQMKRYGKGFARAALAAANTAGVRTTAVASFDSNAVTSVATTKTRANKRDAEPLASFTASAASQLNTPRCRASSAINIMPVRNR